MSFFEFRAYTGKLNLHGLDLPETAQFQINNFFDDALKRRHSYTFEFDRSTEHDVRGRTIIIRGTAHGARGDREFNVLFKYAEDGSLISANDIDIPLRLCS